MKSASDFIVDLRRSEQLRSKLDSAFSTIDRSDPDECIRCIAEVGSVSGYTFSPADYKDAVEEFVRNKLLKDIPTPDDPLLEGPWTTSGHSCVSSCPTRSDVCP